MLTLVVGNFERQPPVVDRKPQAVGALEACFEGAQWLEPVLFDQVEDGDAPLLLDIGVTPDDRRVIELDMGNAGPPWTCHFANAKRTGQRGG